MRTASRWVLVAAVAFSVAGMASAQTQRQRPGGQPGGPGGFGGMTRGGGGGAMLLSNEGVQKELKVTDDQKTKIKEFTDAQRTKMREAFGGGGQPDREKMQEAFKASAEAGEKFVKDTLTADQQTRLKQISLQQQGLMAFTTEDVQKKLSLTDDQKEKIKGLNEEMRKDNGELARDLRGGGDAATEARKKMQAISKEYMAKASDSLTDDQKKTWKDMTGEPFEVKMDGQTGGRRPGGDTGGTPRRRPGGTQPPAGGDKPPAEKKADPK
jgi:Spy/CpxP family protein refolding chaperone